MDEMDYGTLVQNVLNGDKNSFTTLYQATSRQVYVTCWSFFSNEQDSKDMMQETYITAMQKLSTLNDPSKFSAWVCQIAANKCKNELAKRNVNAFYSEDEAADATEENENFLPEEYAMQQEKRDIVLRVIREELSFVQYETILMYYYDQMSVEEIASVMDCPDGTVKYRLSAARAKIKSGIMKYEAVSGTKLYSNAVPLLAVVLFYEFANIAVPNVIDAVASVGLSAMPQQMAQAPAQPQGPQMNLQPQGPQINPQPQQVGPQINPQMNPQMAPQTGASAAGNATTKAAGGFLKTTASKIIAASIAGVIVIGGIVAGVAIHNKNKNNVGNNNQQNQAGNTNSGNSNGNGNIDGSVDGNIDGTVTGDGTGTSDNLIAADSINVGDYVSFGTYEQDNDLSSTEPIIWQAVAVSDGYVTLVSNEVLDGCAYRADGENVSWAGSDIRAFVNGEFYDTAFSSDEKAAMKEQTTVCVNRILSRELNMSGEETQDMVSAISVKDLENYFDMYQEAECGTTPYALTKGVMRNTYLLADSSGDNQRVGVCSSGEFHFGYPNMMIGGVRPVICVKEDYLKSCVVAVEKETNIEAYEHNFQWFTKYDLTTGQLDHAPAEAYTAVSDGQRLALPLTEASFSAFQYCMSYTLDVDDPVTFDEFYSADYTIPAHDTKDITLKYSDDAEIRYQLDVYNFSDADMTLRECIQANWFAFGVNSYNDEDTRLALGIDNDEIKGYDWYGKYSIWSDIWSLDKAMETFGAPNYIGVGLTIDNSLDALYSLSATNPNAVLDISVLNTLTSAGDRNSDGGTYTLGWVFDDYTVVAIVLDNMQGNSVFQISHAYVMPNANWVQVCNEEDSVWYGPNRIDELTKTYNDYIVEKEPVQYAAEFSGNASVGDVVSFGTYEQDAVREDGTEPIQWTVMKVENGKAMLVCNNVLDQQCYNKDTSFGEFGSTTLGGWLDGEFYNSAFSDDDKSKIANVNGRNVTILSVDDYNAFFSDEEAARCVSTRYAIEKGISINHLWSGNGSNYWLITPGANADYCHSVESDGDHADDDNCYTDYIGVRPVIWVNN